MIRTLKTILFVAILGISGFSLNGCTRSTEKPESFTGQSESGKHYIDAGHGHQMIARD
jgi:hypothetical protein